MSAVKLPRHLGWSCARAQRAPYVTNQYVLGSESTRLPNEYDGLQSDLGRQVDSPALALRDATCS